MDNLDVLIIFGLPMTDVLMNCNLLAEKVKSFFGLWWKIGIGIPIRRTDGGKSNLEIVGGVLQK
jgi:hypothetical protein